MRGCGAQSLLALVRRAGAACSTAAPAAAASPCTTSTAAALLHGRWLSTAPPAAEQPPAPEPKPITGDYSQLVFRNTAGELASQADTPAKEIGMCAGVPLETFKRKARIHSPARTAGQQGLANTIYGNKGRPWKITFDTQEKWINPLMGWTSTADPLENVGRASLLFATKEAALAFCTKHGWEADVVEPNQRRMVRQKRFMGYGDNFSIKRAGLPDLSTLPSERGVGKAAPASSSSSGTKASSSSKASSKAAKQ